MDETARIFQRTKPSLPLIRVFALLVLIWASPAFACVDSTQNWGFNPEAIARATQLIERGRYHSDARRGDCALRVYKLLKASKESDVCEDRDKCFRLYRRFLDKLIGYLSAAKNASFDKKQRDFFDLNLREVRVYRSMLAP